MQIPLKWPLLSFSGLLVITSYCFFTSVSWILYPEPYSPLTHYLSALGDWRKGVFGAFFYNAGCVLTGIALVPFFVGIKEWYSGRLWRDVLLVAVQGLGVCSAGALIMIGIFSQDFGTPHMIASGVFFFLNFVVLLLASVTLATHPKFIILIAVYGLVVDVLSLVLESVLGGPIIEWLTVFGSLGFVALLSFNTFGLRVRQ